MRPGDTLSAIAARYGTDWQQLYAANRTAIGPDPAYLRVGQRLTVPGADSRTPSSSRSAAVSPSGDVNLPVDVQKRLIRW
ncbi:LysM peptidoglycan-binding domain-containing protein [Geodermatophilus chilensis]|uniref:LysM peptidoglycan-binding domain-containing protein n=1 Tax=Geodermatophilus chilensis TaxID=2035835 RepID=UPI0018E4BFC9|nr:LysM domain-containing protein [Geodermatophilus chilensis]